MGIIVEDGVRQTVDAESEQRPVNSSHKRLPFLSCLKGLEEAAQLFSNLDGPAVKI